MIRDGVVEDALAMMKLHERSVLGLCGADYTREQLEGWVKRSTLENYQLRLKIHRSFIAEHDGEMVGYVRWNPATNELCSIFVNPNHVRKGIATALMKRAYDDARVQGVKEMWLDASLTAVPFYKTEGWQYIELMQNGSLACVRMTKIL